MSTIRYDFRPDVTRPVLVCAFEGWNDGGEAASTAVAYLRDRLGARRFASVDPEEYFDFQAYRPTVRLVDGVTRAIDWPANDFYVAQHEGRDLILLVGTEPSMRWRTFSSEVIGLAADLDVDFMVTLGAFLADVPHTQPSPVTGSAANPEVSQRLSLAPSRYEGPTGIVGVLHDAATRSGLTTISLWAAVPHYLPGEENPRAAIALLEKLEQLLGVAIERDTLERAASAWDTRIARAVEENEDLAGYIRQLEEASDRDETVIPSGEALAAELERYLRERPDGPSA